MTSSAVRRIAMPADLIRSLVAVLTFTVVVLLMGEVYPAVAPRYISPRASPLPRPTPTVTIWLLGDWPTFTPRKANVSVGPLAQLAEQRTFNPSVLGSSPRRPTALTCMFVTFQDLRRRSRGPLWC